MKGFFCKITLALCFVIFVGSAARADEVTFSANAPMVVTAGESFRVEFSLNATPDDDSFEAPDFGAFDVLAGPAISQGHSIQIINGAMTKNVNYTITYVLLAQDAGNITIGPASIKVDKKRYKTQPLPIEISDKPSAGSAQASQGNSGSSDKSIEEEAQGQIAKDDLLLRVHISKQSVFKGEPLLATFKLYRRVAIVGYEDIKFPSFNGFWTQDIDVSNAMWQRETLNGKVYESTVVKECLLYPQQAGTLVIEPATITAIAQVIVQSRRNIDPFFGGGHEVYNLRRKLQTPRVNITVKELPAGAPASFTGAVGKFSMEASLSADQLAANSAGTFTVKITGQGNLPFIQAPKLTLPASFEQYNVKTTESIQTATAGTSGYRQFEYPFIARAEGTYRIDSILFTYFNPDRREYVTLSSQSFPLQITPDANGGELHDQRTLQGGRSDAGTGHPFHPPGQGTPPADARAILPERTLYRTAGCDSRPFRRNLHRAAQADPRIAERRPRAGQAGQQGRRAAVPRREAVYGGAEPACLLRGDAPRAVGVHG